MFTLAQTAFSLFSDSDHSPESWPLNSATYRALEKATSPERSARYQSIEEFKRSWQAALENR